MFASAHPDNSESRLVITLRRPNVNETTAMAEEAEDEDDADLNIEEYIPTQVIQSTDDEESLGMQQVFLSIFEPIINIRSILNQPR